MLDAFRDHGKPRASLEENDLHRHAVMETLEAVGISMKQATDELVTQAVRLFAEPFHTLLNSVDVKCKLTPSTPINPQTYRLPADLQTQFQEAVDD